MAESNQVRSRYDQMFAAPWRLMDLVMGFCLSPVLDRAEEVDPQAEQLYQDARRLKRDLDILFSADMRREVIVFLKHLDANREEYRKSLLLWLDLVEEFAFEVEKDLGDGTGPVKLRRVRGAVFYFLNRFSEGLQVPGIPAYFNRLALHIIIRGTVEFIVTLVNTDKVEQRSPVRAAAYNRGLWREALPREGMATAETAATPGVWRRVKERCAQWWRAVVVRVLKWYAPLIERFVNWVLDILMAPPGVSADMRRRIDKIVADFNRNAPPGQPPVEGLARWFLDVIKWVGAHGKEVRAAIDVFSIAVHWTSELSDLTRERRIELIENALILYFDDIGLSGPYFRFMLRFLVDINLDAMLFLYEKRGVPIDGRQAASL